MQTAAIFRSIFDKHHLEAIVPLDGICNFCNSTVNFLIENDLKRKLRYAPLQSDWGTALQHELPKNLDSIICITASNVLIRSDAVIQIAKLLPYPYRLLSFGQVIPKKWRDCLYDTFSKRRCQWFGKSEQCRILTTEERSLFIETFGDKKC